MPSSGIVIWRGLLVTFSVRVSAVVVGDTGEDVARVNRSTDLEKKLLRPSRDYRGWPRPRHMNWSWGEMRSRLLHWSC